MRTAVTIAAIGLVGLGASAGAQSLPSGLYAINGTVTAMSGGFCPAPAKWPVTGTLLYPGPGQSTTQLSLQSVTLRQSVTLAFMSAFPPVPAGGLNGWSAQAPASPNYLQYENGELTGGGTSAILSFDLTQAIDGPLAAAQGTLTLTVDSIGPCAETILATFQRTAPFPKE
jgi:hypothetical protein